MKTDSKQNLLINSLGMEIEHLGEGLGEIKSAFKQSCVENNTAHKEILNKIDDFIETADVKYVSRTEFKDVKSAVYGFIAIVLTAVVGGIMALVLK
jgi:uncharacterized membrane-anchored protein